MVQEWQREEAKRRGLAIDGEGWMTAVKFWSHPECDRAEPGDECYPCLLWGAGLHGPACQAAAEADR